MQNSASIIEYPAIVVCAVVAFMLQWIVFVPSYLKQTERFYDLTGSSTFIIVTCLALYGAYSQSSIAAEASPLSLYKVILGLMVIIWAARLGSFLFIRIHQDGRDDRFNELKTDPSRFFVAWTIQGLWVVLTAGAGFTAILSDSNPSIGIVSLIGFGIWLLGFGIEVVADRQKRQFKRSSSPSHAFITTGLWSYSRHPNYLGEILLWFGVAIVALPMLTGWQHVALISPIFVAVLLTIISGIPFTRRKS
jgi:steroid 5-alpha reductase family enzyme